MPARSIDTATLTFGLVAIPVKIYATSEHSHEVHFHLVHEGCGERLHQQYVCPRHGAVDRDQIIKGYELRRGSFVELSRDELEALEAVASDEITIEEFVPGAAVDPLLVAHTYYLGPGKGGERAYRLFRDALAAADLVGIASYAARGHQYLVELRPYQTGLAMFQLHYADEVKPWSEVPASSHGKPSSAELALARKVIDNLRRQTFDPSRYKDEVKARVRQLIAQKAKGGEIVAPPTVEREPVADLMAALKASLSGEGASRKAGDGAARKTGEGVSRKAGDGAWRRAGEGASRKVGDGASRRAGEGASRKVGESAQTQRAAPEATHGARGDGAGTRRASVARRSSHASHTPRRPRAAAPPRHGTARRAGARSRRA